MRVAHLLGSLNRGGAEVLVLNIFSQIQDCTMNFILLHRRKGSLYDNFKNSKYTTQWVKPNNKIDLFYLVKVRNILKKERVEIVHTHQVIDALIAIIATIGTNIKVIFTVHGHGLNDNFIQKTFREFVLKKSDLNIFVSNSLYNFYLNKYSDIIINSKNCQTLYNGISFDVSRERSISQPLKFRNDCLALGMVGNFTSVRDHLTICRFLLLLDKNNIDFDFVFIGAKSGGEAYIYESCINLCTPLIEKGKVRFVGSRDDVFEILHQLDAFLYASAHDTFGIAVVEAMCVGVPVFVNDWQVMFEITNKGEWATIYNSKDENDLLKKMIFFLENIEFYQKLAQYYSKKVKDRYNIKRHCSDLSNIYKSLLNN